MRGFALAISRRENIEGAARNLLSIDGVQEVHVVTGQYDFLIELEGDNLDSIYETVANEMVTIQEIEDTETLIGLKTFG